MGYRPGGFGGMLLTFATVPGALYQPFPIPTEARAHIWRFQRTLGCTPRDFFGTNLRRQMVETFSPWTPSSADPQRAGQR